MHIFQNVLFRTFFFQKNARNENFMVARMGHHTFLIT